jgi:hypothetical protein
LELQIATTLAPPSKPPRTDSPLPIPAATKTPAEKMCKISWVNTWWASCGKGDALVFTHHVRGNHLALFSNLLQTQNQIPTRNGIKIKIAQETTANQNRNQNHTRNNARLV